MHGSTRAVLVAALVVAGCGSKKDKEGLPPAQDWQASGTADPPMGGGPPAMANSPHSPHGGGDPNNPHAGVDMNDPHGGVDMGGGGGGTDVTKLGLSAPDPSRAIDPKHHVKGVITVDAKTKSLVVAGTAVFVIVKRAGPDGAPMGPPLAVDKLTWGKDELPFELSEAQAMVAGTELTGDVVVLARYDHDGDALSKDPGDITGSIRVTIPADNVKLPLDTILP